MAYRFVEVLVEFVSAADQRYVRQDPLRRYDGIQDSIWRQFVTPDMFKRVLMKEKSARESERYRLDPSVRERAQARYEQDKRLREEAKRTQFKNDLARARSLCDACKKKMPGTGWCPVHGGNAMVSRISDPKGYVKQRVHHADNGKDKPLCGKLVTKTDVVVEKAIMADCPACIEKAGLEPLVEAKKHEPTVMDNADADTLLKVARQLVEHISKAPELVGSAAGDLAQTFTKLDELMCSAKRPKAWQ
jgi:hypothetical protein